MTNEGIEEVRRIWATETIAELEAVWRSIPPGGMAYVPDFRRITEAARTQYKRFYRSDIRSSWLEQQITSSVDWLWRLDHGITFKEAVPRWRREFSSGDEHDG